MDFGLDLGLKEDYFYPLQYESDYGYYDSEIIEKRSPFRFLNLYCMNTNSYPIINLHLEEVVNFLEKAKKNNKKVLIFDTKINLSRKAALEMNEKNLQSNSNINDNTNNRDVTKQTKQIRMHKNYPSLSK